MGGTGSPCIRAARTDLADEGPNPRTDTRVVAYEWLGDLGTWVAGLATAGGLVFAGVQIRDGRKERAAEDARRAKVERDQHLARARSITVSSLATKSKGGWHLEFTVMNGSDYPIHSAVLVVHSLDPACDPKAQMLTAYEHVIGTMHRGQIVKDEIDVQFSGREPVFGEHINLACVLFTDAWDESWCRGSGSLEAMDAPPRIC